tara:strand:- start:806 stop:976 length:171 start_codon:yes stop_codon:yes gene_type:complete
MVMSLSSLVQEVPKCPGLPNIRGAGIIAFQTTVPVEMGNDLAFEQNGYTEEGCLSV